MSPDLRGVFQVQAQVDEVNALKRQRDARVERQLALAGLDVVELVEYLAPLIQAELQ